MGKHRKHKKEKKSKRSRRSSFSDEEFAEFYRAFKAMKNQKRKRSPSSSESSRKSEDSSSERELSTDRLEKSQERSPKRVQRNTESPQPSDPTTSSSSTHKNVQFCEPEEVETAMENQSEEPPEVSEAVRELFGHSRIEQKLVAPAINEDLATLWKEVSHLGLTAEDRKILATKYPVMMNCDFLEPPKVNEIVKTAVGSQIVERDERLVAKQNRFKVCLAAIAKALTPLIHTKNDADHQLVEILCDVGRMAADGFFEENNIRRFLLTQTVNETWRKTLRETVSGEWLFGEKLEDKLQAAKALAKSIEELKPKKPTVQSKNSAAPPRRFLPKTTVGGQASKFQKPAPPRRYNQPQKATNRPRSSSTYHRSRSHSRHSYDTRSRSSRR